jgi:hypothetical protein
MELEAASSVINFMSAIESQSAEWYTQHSRNQPNLETQFTAFAGENQNSPNGSKNRITAESRMPWKPTSVFKASKQPLKSRNRPNPRFRNSCRRSASNSKKASSRFTLQAAALSKDLLADFPVPWNALAGQEKKGSKHISRYSDQHKMSPIRPSVPRRWANR